MAYWARLLWALFNTRKAATKCNCTFKRSIFIGSFRLWMSGGVPRLKDFFGDRERRCRAKTTIFD